MAGGHVGRGTLGHRPTPRERPSESGGRDQGVAASN